MLRSVLQHQDPYRTHSCTLARFRNEANKLDIQLTDYDYETIYLAFKVLKKIGYGE